MIIKLWGRFGNSNQIVLFRLESYLYHNFQLDFVSGWVLGMTIFKKVYLVQPKALLTHAYKVSIAANLSKVIDSQSNSFHFGYPTIIIKD